MNPIINPMIFYWIDLSNKLIGALLVIAFTFLCFCLISISVVDTDPYGDVKEYVKRHLKKSAYGEQARISGN